MSQNSNFLESNLRNLTELIRKNPLATHAIFRRPDGVAVDIPLMSADYTIRQRTLWVLEDLAGGTYERKEVAKEEDPIVPPKPSEEKPPEQLAADLSQKMASVAARPPEDELPANPAKPVPKKKAAKNK